MSAPRSDIQGQYASLTKMEKLVIAFIDSCLSDDGKARIADIFNSLSYSGASLEILSYVGQDPPALARFIRDRRHLWRVTEEDIHARPNAFRAAIVDLVASIVKNQNRAPLGDIFFFFQRHHPQAMPYLPAPTNGSSLESVKNLVLEFPKLFRLLNADDGNEWTRTSPLAQVVVECVSMVRDGVILVGISPKATSAMESKAGSENVIQGIAEVLRITPAWGYLRSDTYGTIFFTPRACGSSGESLQNKGLRLGLRVFFEATPSSDHTQKFNNLPVKWRATLVRQLTAEERDPLGQVKSTSAESAAASSVVDQLSSTFSSSLSGVGNSHGSSPAFGQMSSSNSSKDSSPQPKADQGGMKKLPTGLAEWMKKRQQEATIQNRTPSPRQATPSPSTVQIQAGATAAVPAAHSVEQIEDELDIEWGSPYDSYHLEQAGRYLSNGLTEHPLHHRSTVVPETTRPFHLPPEEVIRPNDGLVGFNSAGAAEDYPEYADVAVQTDPTDEELLLRLLRQAPEFLDLVRVVMR